MSGWSFWIDRGGTFTDAIGRDPSGQLHVTKQLSSDEAPLTCIRALLGLPAGAPIPPCDVRMGTTLATNALLERRGVRFVLVTARGLGDVLEIGTQQRPELFALHIVKPSLLYARVLELDARLDAQGHEVVPLDRAAVRAALAALRAEGEQHLAVVLPHAYAHPVHELAVGEVARELGFASVVLSHEVDRELGLVGRGDTTCVDAYLTPLLHEYVAKLSASLPGSRLGIMTSSGGLSSAARFRGRDAIVSGPAGGVVAVAHVARTAGHGRAIGFDMGGTSTDVCRWDGTFARTYEAEVAGVRVRAPMLALHTVAAGGGSICRYEGQRLVVGPHSAGARPGPLCYGDPSATALTITDVDLHLGRVAADRFPIVLDGARVARALDDVARALAADGHTLDVDAIAAGFFDVANVHMAEAIRRVSIAEGHALDDTPLVVFGGAGGQHACAVARLLGIRRLLVHPLGGVMSAWGIGLAQRSWHGEADVGREVLSPLVLARARAQAERLEAEGRRALVAEGATELQVEVTIDVRYAGTDHVLGQPWSSDVAAVAARFHAEHRRALGYAREGAALEVVCARVEVREAQAHAARVEDQVAREPLGHKAQRRTTRLYAEGRWHERVPVYYREDLTSVLEGPALVLDATAALALDPGFRLSLGPDGLLVLDDVAGARADAPPAPGGGPVVAPDPVHLELYAHRFMALAQDMGEVLRRTARSTNIRERLDFSCAVFDGGGDLVANAPHIPVHLGAMGETVRAVIAAHPRMEDGDVYASNDPSMGGSHLPDITVVTPVYVGGVRRFFTACRGHHADVGGLTPGSMPPHSRTLADEGVVLSALRIVHCGALDEVALRARFEAGPHPARRVAENLADLEAQVAANHAGARLLAELVAARGLPEVMAYMRHVQENAALRVRQAIAALPDGARELADRLDDGTVIRVRLEITGDRLRVDFSGSSPEHLGNLNAPRAVVVAAVLYVLRALVGVPIPLNQGCLEPVELVVPRPSVLDPSPGRAVVAGNVETSQRVVDVLLGALGVAAASQGTMNNLTFGDASFGYYETIAGGAGAGPGFAGAHAVHTHMTNTRITDLEVLETRFPVRLVEFRVRRGSGGAGQYAGGDGVVRTFEALSPLDVSILSERRRDAPFGLARGAPGQRGRNLHAGRELGGREYFVVQPGERVTIETPGGGGYGAPTPSSEGARVGDGG